MKLILAFATVLLLISGCSQQPAAVVEDVTEAPAAAIAIVPEVSAKCPPSNGYALPEGVALDLPLHLRADRITIQNGQDRRILAFEFLDGTDASVLSSVIDAMMRAGYVAKDQKVVDSRTIASFKNNGTGVVHAAVSSDAGPTPSNPLAKGVLTFNMPYASGTVTSLDDSPAAP